MGAFGVLVGYTRERVRQVVKLGDAIMPRETRCAAPGAAGRCALRRCTAAGTSSASMGMATSLRVKLDRQ